MLKFTTLLSTIFGVVPLKYSKGRVTLYYWALPMQLVYLGIGIYIVYMEIEVTVKSWDLYQKIANEFKGHAGNSSADHLLQWSTIRILSEYCDIFSWLLGLVLSWGLRDIINTCLEVCSESAHSRIPPYAKSTSLVVLSGLLLSNTALLLCSYLSRDHYKVAWKAFIGIFVSLPGAVVENYFLLMCLLLSEEVSTLSRAFSGASLLLTPQPWGSMYFGLEGEDLTLRLRHYRERHLQLLNLVQYLNNKFQAYLSICLFGSVLNPIILWYRIILEVSSNKATLFRAESILRQFNFNLTASFHLFSVWIICYGPHTISRQFSELELQLGKALIKVECPESVGIELHYVKRQCRDLNTNMDIYGMFKLTTGFFFSGVMGVVTYVTVLKQFNVDGRSFWNPKEFLSVHRYLKSVNDSHLLQNH